MYVPLIIICNEMFISNECQASLSSALTSECYDLGVIFLNFRSWDMYSFAHTGEYILTVLKCLRIHECLQQQNFALPCIPNIKLGSDLLHLEIQTILPVIESDWLKYYQNQDPFST